MRYIEPFEMNTILKEYKNLLVQKRYSNNTIDIYCSYFEDFCKYFNKQDIGKITIGEINSYILTLMKSKNISTSQQNQRINAIKFYYEKVLGRKKQYYELHRPKKDHKLPQVLSKEEIKLIISKTTNIKHQMIISLLYSGGLRRSEVLELEISDIRSDRGIIMIRGAKGKKDRYTLLSNMLLEQLRKYYRQYKPRKYLFEGQKGGKYSAESVSKILKRAGKKAEIKRPVTPHMLRHSFATHLLEQGTDLRYIQELLGHNSTKTTEIYTHVATKNFKNIKNPIDEIIK